MRPEFSILLDALASFGLLVLLALAYGLVKRNMTRVWTSQIVLGVLFGIVAAAEMFRPIEPTPGLIIDLRSVPIALAGAFLGWRGALVSVAIAAAVRVEFGGVGMVSGLIGMGIAAMAGLVWAQAMHNMARRKLEHFVLLGALTCLHLLAGLALPETVRTWFFSEAAVPLMALNLAAVPLVGLALEWQRCTMLHEKALRAAARIDPESGLLTARVFRRECMIRATASADGAYSLAAFIRIGKDRWTFGSKDAAARRRLLAAMRLRLRDSFEQSRLAGVHEDDVLLIPLLQEHVINTDEFSRQIKRVLSDEPFLLTDGVKYTPSVSVDIIPVNDKVQFAHALQHRIRRQTRILARHMTRSAGEMQPVAQLVAARHSIDAVSEQSLDQMFYKAEFLMRSDLPKRRAG